MHVTITHITSNTLVREGTIRIHNPDIPSIPDTSDEGAGDVAVYSAALVWQNTTHLLTKEDGTLSEYTCDPGESECVINPLIIPSKDGQESSALTCLVTADFDLSA